VHPPQNYQYGDLQGIEPVYSLNGENYLKWSQLVCTMLKGKGKSAIWNWAGPKEGDPNITAWDEEDSLIIACLWNSINISDTIMFLNVRDTV